MALLSVTGRNMIGRVQVAPPGANLEEPAQPVDVAGLLQGNKLRRSLRRTDVPPVLNSAATWSPIHQSDEIGQEEALFRRADHWLAAGLPVKEVCRRHGFCETSY